MPATMGALLSAIASFRIVGLLTRERMGAETQSRADGPVLAGRHPFGLPASEAASTGRRLISVLKGQATEALPGVGPRKAGRAISDSGHLVASVPAAWVGDAGGRGLRQPST